MSLTQSKPARNADLRHKQSVGRQRKHAVRGPQSRVEAIYRIIQKHVADGQLLPDLAKYDVTEDVWAELTFLLSGSELEAVKAAYGDESDDDDLEPTIDELNATFANVANDDTMPDDVPPADTPQQTPDVAHGWHDAFPVHTHSLSWTDSDGISHSHTVRSDNIDDILRQVKTIKVVIAAAKARDAKTSTETAQEKPMPEGWCELHDIQMKRKTNERGSWWSHKTSDGWCRGKAKA